VPTESPQWLMMMGAFLLRWSTGTTGLSDEVEGKVASLHRKYKADLVDSGLLEKLQNFQAHWVLRDTHRAFLQQARASPEPATLYVHIDFAVSRPSRH
jgi:sulfite reductase beta subunit-like hemoprotein